MHKDKIKEERERSYEYGLPSYLQHDLDAYKKGLEEKSSLLDCLWGELYGSINIAEINDGSITSEHADYLRKKFLFWTVFFVDSRKYTFICPLSFSATIIEGIGE